MKNLFISILLFLPCIMHAQLGFKAGLNFANVTNASSINASSRTGFNVGLFFAGSSKGLLSSRSVLVLSRHGYNFSSYVNTGKIELDYLMLPQFMGINITKYVQIQVGAQLSYLINAKIDSTNSTGSPTGDKVINLMNRFDYGFGGGIEVHPVKMVLIGARVNVSLGKLYKVPEEGKEYSFIPDVNIRNNLFQLYAGLRFGGD